MTGPETTILSVMNGLESEEVIGAACGMDKMVHAIAIGIDAMREGESFTYYARPAGSFSGRDRGRAIPAVSTASGRSSRLP